MISFESGLNKKIKNDNVGNFFNLVYLKDSPEIVRTRFERKITDTTLILQAGFSIEDIENMPK